LSECEAANLEYSIFEKAGNMMIYKANVVKKLKEIRKMTEDRKFYRFVDDQQNCVCKSNTCLDNCCMQCDAQWNELQFVKS